ncbi:Zinc transporter ZupT [Geosmithia morbida]|uniref:Zinc transporter ZupT n=1 Tax=Geosmithia morbida TaxID=1094350 RepID=A0A9P4YZG5_9HYPO|nr:Zinc transporter ZupT [Geosmithia morbida]KAF4124900.1 Zinc transporter ZupT [Geosmithia morbida]
MICLSKADEASFKEMSFNQSPAPLSGENTTRQDLNGISNLRELVSAGQNSHEAGPGAGGGGMALAASAGSGADEKHYQGFPHPGSPGVGRQSPELSSRHWATFGGEDQRLLSQAASPFETRPCCSFWGWAAWISSVLSVSFILTFAIVCFSPSSSSAPITTTTITAASSAPDDLAPRDETSSPSPVTFASLLRKRDTCEQGGVKGDTYDTPLHVGALLLIWFVSTAGSSFALLAQKVSCLRIPARFFFVVRHFGTGVLIATAFVHLLPTAFVSLNDPCLGSFFTDGYQALPGAIALGAVFLVTIIEMVFHPSRHCTSALPLTRGPDIDNDDEKVAKVTPPDSDIPRSPIQGMVRDLASPKGRTSSVGRALSHLHSNGEASDGEMAAVDMEQLSGPGPSAEQKLRKERLQVLLLEMGILFHSVFIGMSVSVAVGTDFIVLLIAIVFHQTFEGLALGSRIAAINWGEGSRQPWIMAIAYGLTTPLGQALGIATHTLYSPDSAVGLIVVGVMNSISAGLLTFASLVELMAEDFLSDDSWKHLRGKSRVLACLLVFVGAFGMSLVGAWA